MVDYSLTVMRDGLASQTETTDVKLLSTLVDAGPLNVRCTFHCPAPLVPTIWTTICQDYGK